MPIVAATWDEEVVEIVETDNAHDNGNAHAHDKLKVEKEDLVTHKVS